MSDQNNLSKPDLSSNYSTEVLQTLRGHIIRLWTMDYSGMGGLVAGLKRTAFKTVRAKKHIEIYNNGADGTETKLFDSMDLLPTGVEDVPGLQEALNQKGQFGDFTVRETDGNLQILYGQNIIWQIDSTGNVSAEQNVTAKKTL
ncbi:hypothetical protein [Photobacterium profundum]|nr:hypothetical protein [Photobacterium profundum]